MAYFICIQNNLKADYEIIAVKSDRVFLIDLDKGSKSVTNDAERVYAEVIKQQPNKRVIYRDSQKNWDEIIMLNGKIGFRHYSEYSMNL